MITQPTLEFSEIFMSLEGEGPFTSHPVNYLRLARCNFKCAGFNNPNKLRDSKGYAPLGFIPKDFTSLQDLPLISTGCDSQYSVNPEFSHMWEKLTTSEVAQRLVDNIPAKKWKHPKTGLPVICSITGGEPTLRAKQLPDRKSVV